MQYNSPSLLSDEDPQAAYMTLSDNHIRNMWVTGDFLFLFQLKMNTKTINFLWKDVLGLEYAKYTKKLIFEKMWVTCLCQITLELWSYWWSIANWNCTLVFQAISWSIFIEVELLYLEALVCKKDNWNSSIISKKVCERKVLWKTVCSRKPNILFEFGSSVR